MHCTSVYEEDQAYLTVTVFNSHCFCNAFLWSI